MVDRKSLSRRAVAGTACAVFVALALQGCGSSKTSSLFGIGLSTSFFVPYAGYSRVLQYTTPLSNGKAATLAIGQTDLTSGGVCSFVPSTTASKLCNPIGIAFDAAGNLWVADANVHRVLQFRPPLATNMAASLELGHPSGTAFTSTSPNNGGRSGSSMDNPTALAFDDAGNLWVAD